MTTRTRIKILAPFALLAGLLLGIYYEILAILVYQWWDDPNYSHGFLIPLLSGYLIWRKRDRLKKLRRQTSYKGFIVLLFGLVLLILGTAGAELFTMRLSFVVVVSGLAFYFLGEEIIREIWFSLAFLVFMIPIPYVIYYSLTFPMQLMATKMAAAALTTLGIPLLRQGNILHLSGFSLEVIEACSGLRSVLSLSALGAAFAYLTQRSTFKRVLLFTSSIPIAILANVVRLVVTAIGAMIIGPQFVDSLSHVLSGVLVFLVALLGLVIEGEMINWFGRARSTGSPSV